jgi:molecular chaperone HscB
LKCNAELASPIVCTGCQALYLPPQSTDYFDLLGLERCYAIDEEKLAAAFRAITRNIHPDRFVGQPAEVRNLATRLSAEVNEAISVLGDGVQRAAYMLELAGGPSAAEVREVPGSLLADVMMFREQMEEARSADDEVELERLHLTLRTRREASLQRIADRADRLASSSDDQKKEFRRLLNSIKYFDNLLSAIP